MGQVPELDPNMSVLGPGINMSPIEEIFSKNPGEELGTSLQAFLLCYIDKDGSTVSKVIRGFDRDAYEYSLALQNFLNSDTSGLKDLMRSLNTLTIQPNGSLYVTHVEDKNIMNGNINTPNFLENLINMSKEIEYGETNSQLNGLCLVQDVIVYNEVSGQFTDGSSILGDVSVETFLPGEIINRDIENVHDSLNEILQEGVDYTDDHMNNEYEKYTMYDIEEKIRQNQLDNLIDQMVEEDVESTYIDDVDGALIPEG